MGRQMISRRSFLFHIGLTPILGFIGNVRAIADTKTAFIEGSKAIPVETMQSADFAIEGWHDDDCDPRKTRIIAVSTSWKSDWL